MGSPPSAAEREQRTTMARSAAAIYLGAIAVVGLETALPGGPTNSIVPGILGVVMAPIAFFVGPHLGRRGLAVFAPIGVVCIAMALATTQGGVTDGAVLYMWPVLWMSYFYGRPGAIFIVAFVALAQGAALTYMPDDQVSIDRWIDVVASVTVVAAVVHYLASRNASLVGDLEHQARVDPLTGLLNRRGLEERMAIEVTRARRQGTSVAIAIVDVDHFKAVNDEHGHEVGDRVLAWVAFVLDGESRGVDAPARTGGDEFAVLMPDADEVAGHRFADRVRRRVDDPASPERTRHGVPEALRLTISVGVASSSTGDTATLMSAADKALYDAKGGGRNRVVARGGHALSA